jgi:hypothetical protein
MFAIAGKQDVPGLQTIQGAFVVFYYPGGVTEDELGEMMNFANKFAGYGRGDINNDGNIDLRDLCYFIRYISGNGPPVCPFEYTADVNLDDNVDLLDFQYMYNYMFNGGPYPLSKLRF